MNRYVIATGTITHAIKAKDVLKKNGIKAEIERMKHGAENYGCGYAVLVSVGNINYVEELLKKNSVKILMVSKIK